VSIDAKRFSVCDQGALTIADTQGPTTEPFVQGLGLYILDMACKHLQWHMSVQDTAEGRCSQLEFSDAIF
jgi:hypothetical protein